MSLRTAEIAAGVGTLDVGIGAGTLSERYTYKRVAPSMT